jgi:hypothetical protein
MLTSSSSPARFVEAFDHLVEGLREGASLVGCDDGHSGPEIAGADTRRRPLQIAERGHQRAPDEHHELE